MIKSCLAIIISLMPSLLLAGTFHVSSNGVDSVSCGSVSSPCLSIERAISNAVHGNNLIKVALGHYKNHINLGKSEGQELTIQGGWNESFTTQKCELDNTSLTGTDDDLPVIFSTNISIKVYAECFRVTSISGSIAINLNLSSADHVASKFVMKKCKIDGFNNSGVLIKTSNEGNSVEFLLEDSIVTNISSTDNALPYFSAVSATALENSNITLTLKRNKIINNLKKSGDENLGAGVLFYANSHGRITGVLENNIIADNIGARGAGLAAYQYGGDGFIHLRLTNNSIINNTSTVIGGGVYLYTPGSLLYAHDTSALIRNNIIYGNSAPGQGKDFYQRTNACPSLGDAGTDYDYSIIDDIFIFDAAGCGAVKVGLHNLEINPKLDVQYMLSSDSPAINSGQCGYLDNDPLHSYVRVAPFEDINGESRPGNGQLASCDIGADEYSNNSICFPIKTIERKVSLICL